MNRLTVLFDERPPVLDGGYDWLVAARPEGLLLVDRSDAGPSALEGDQFVGTVGPKEPAAQAMAWRDKGIDLIGACCGSSPEHLAAIVEARGW